jgi:repressor LexA
MRIDDEETLRAIARYVDAEGIPPTYRDLCAALRVASTSGVSYRVKRLLDRGWVERRPFTARTLRVTEDGARRLRRGGAA